MMHTLALWLTGIVLYLQPHPLMATEPLHEYAARGSRIEHAVARVTHNRDEAVAVLVKWASESHFDARVHAGLQHPIWTQDGGRARCMGQIHANRRLLHDEWLALAGTDSDATERCARATLGMLRSAVYLCAPHGVQSPADMARVYAHYANGLNCNPTAASTALAATWDKLRRHPWPKAPPLPAPDENPVPAWLARE